jgi:hypothetical protein
VTASRLEWDDKIPSFDEVHDEALKANAFIAEAGEDLNRKTGKGGKKTDSASRSSR